MFQGLSILYLKIINFNSDKEKNECVTKHRNEIFYIIKKFPGGEKLNLQMECFCVNSNLNSYLKNQSNKNEFNKIRNFAKKF